MSDPILRGLGDNTGRFGIEGRKFEEACYALAGAARHAIKRLREESHRSGDVSEFQAEFAGLEASLDAYTDKMAAALAALSD